MFIWLESLNRPVFTNYLLTVNEPDIDQHIKKMALPNVWGTHVEIIAAATFYQIPVYFTTKENNEHRWEVIKPIPAERIRMPRVMDCLPDSHNNLTHFELAYHTRSHYDSIVSLGSGRPCSSFPILLQKDIDTVVIAE